MEILQVCFRLPNWSFVNHLVFQEVEAMKQYEIWRLGDDLIVPTGDGQWAIAYPAAAQDVAEVRRINKRYGANFSEPSWRLTEQRFATVRAAERWLESRRAAIA
jgi:hypothetical protein